MKKKFFVLFVGLLVASVGCVGVQPYPYASDAFSYQAPQYSSPPMAQQAPAYAYQPPAYPVLVPVVPIMYYGATPAFYAEPFFSFRFNFGGGHHRGGGHRR